MTISPTRRVIFLWFVWVVCAYLVGFIAIYFWHGTGPWYASLDHIARWFPFARWDTGFYLDIAQHGYRLDSLQPSVVFFPLYPFLLSIFWNISGHSQFALLLCASIFSVACSFGIVWIIYKLVSHEFSERIGFLTISLLLSFPAAFFLLAPYSESLFLLFVLLSFFAAQQKRWLISGIFIALASSTRMVGIFSGLALGISYVFEHRHQVGSMYKSLLLLLCGTFGIIGYSLFLWIQFGHPFLFITQQIHFQRWFAIPFVNILRQFQLLAHPFAHTPWQLLVFSFDLVAFVCGIILLMFMKSSNRSAYLIFSLGCLLPIIFSNSLVSTSRYLLVCFPFFVFLSQFFSRLSRTWLIIFIFAQIVLQIIFISLFSTWHFIA